MSTLFHVPCSIMFYIAFLLTPADTHNFIICNKLLYVFLVSLSIHAQCNNPLGEENIVKWDYVSWKVGDTTKREKIAKYLRDRYACKKFSEQKLQKERWLDQWSELYPSPTKTVLYQALIYVGEHAAARSLLPQGELIFNHFMCLKVLFFTHPCLLCEVYMR